MVWEYLYSISTNYVFGGSRYEPYDTDCSGLVCAGFYQVLGIDPLELGWWTGGMWQSPLLDIIYKGDSPDLPFSEMLEDDLIFTSTQSPCFDSFNGSHVGLYTGNQEAPFLSHYANGGPYITAVNEVYGGNEKYFGVARLKGHDMGVWNDSSYQEPFPTGADMGTRLVYIDKYVNEIREMTGNIPENVWEYNYEQTAPFGNMYNCLVNTCNFTMDIKHQLERIEEKLDTIMRNEDDGR